MVSKKVKELEKRIERLEAKYDYLERARDAADQRGECVAGAVFDLLKYECVFESFSRPGADLKKEGYTLAGIGPHSLGFYVRKMKEVKNDQVT